MKIITISLLLFLCRLSFSQTDFWEQTYGPTGGVVHSLAINPQGAIFSGTLEGVFRSTDNGQSWTRASDGLTNPDVRCIIANTAGILFAGTDYYHNGGVFRSTDGGDNWSPVNNGLPGWPIINCFASDSNGHIYAGTQGDGIFKSTTNGDTWSQINAGLSEMYIYSITLSSTGIIYIGTYTGVYSSTNNGGSWHHTSLTSTYAVALSTNLQNYIFVGVQGSGVFRSTDQGNSWIQLSNGLTTNQIRTISVNPGDTIFLGTKAGAFRSVDQGNTWLAINEGLTDTIVSCVAFGADGSTIAGTEKSIFVSTNSGNTWNRSDAGLVASRVQTLSASADGDLYAGTWDGVFHSSNQGNNWSRRSAGLANTFVLATAIDSRGYVYAGTRGGLFRSSNQGTQWTPLLIQPSTDFNSVLLNHSNHIFAGTTYGLFRSTNDGASWTQLGTDTPVFMDFRSLVVDLNETIFAGVGDVMDPVGAVFLSTDNGDTWSMTSLHDLATALAVNSQGHIFAAGRAVFRSTDGGASWAQFSIGPTTHDGIDGLCVNSSGHVFAGTYGFLHDPAGVFRSTDNGETWTQINQGLDNANIGSLAIDSSGFLYAGTYGAGVFRSSQSTTSANVTLQELPTTFLLFQNYPNPWNPSTTVGYRLPHRSFVSITLHNILGEVVAKHVYEEQTPGYHEVAFRSDDLASGIYFYTLNAGTYISTKKMLLLR